MDDSISACLGLDVGSRMTLLAFWPRRPEDLPSQLEPTWPARAPIRALRAIPAIDPSEIRPALAALCAEYGLRSADCALVALGNSSIQAACETAGALNIPAVIRPAAGSALTSGGIMPTQAVREYELPVNPPRIFASPGPAPPFARGGNQQGSHGQAPPGTAPLAHATHIHATKNHAIQSQVTKNHATRSQATRESTHDGSPAVPDPERANLDVLRSCFADLMQRASEDLQEVELDQDDAVLDRFIDVRYAGGRETLTIPAEWLTDAKRLLAPFHRVHAARFGQADEQAAVEILTARLRCITIAMYRPHFEGPAEPPAAVPAPPGWTWQRLNGEHILWTSSGVG